MHNYKQSRLGEGAAKQTIILCFWASLNTHAQI